MTKNQIMCKDCFSVDFSQVYDLVVLDPLYDICLEKFESLVTKILPVLSNVGSVYCFMGSEQVAETKILLDKHLLFRNWIIWARASPGSSKHRYKVTHENILVYSKTDEFIFNKQTRLVSGNDVLPYVNLDGTPRGWFYDEETKERKRWAECGSVWTSVVYDTRPFWSSKEKSKHPMQKPQSLCERIILTSSVENSIILDPFMGSAAFAVACKNNNRFYEGYEICKDRFQEASDYIQTKTSKNLDEFL